MQIVQNSSIEELKRQAGQTLQELFTENLKKPILFLTSGGSALAILENVKIPEGSHISIGVLDERYSEDPTINNFTQLKNTQFFQRSENLFEHILDTSVEKSESLEDFAERFESMLRAWMVENHNGVIVSTIGMGPDGHVSGMMPFPEDSSRFETLFNDGHKLVIGYDAGKKNQYSKRATTTMEFMRRIHHAVVYISGEAKKEAWKRLMVDSGTLNETPARILREMEDVKVFTDLQ